MFRLGVARSFTLTYAVAGALALAVVIGLTSPVVLAQDLWTFSPWAAAAAGGVVFFIVKANLCQWVWKRPLSRLDIALSVIVCLGVALLIWVVAFVTLSALGADFA